MSKLIVKETVTREIEVSFPETDIAIMRRLYAQLLRALNAGAVLKP
jgi:hypothetical protein